MLLVKKLRKELRNLGYSRSDVNKLLKQGVDALKSTTTTDIQVIQVSIDVSGQVLIETVTQRFLASSSG